MHLDKIRILRQCFISIDLISVVFLDSNFMARLLIFFIGVFWFAYARSSKLNIEGSSKRLLVVLDHLGIRESHSFYLKQLEGEKE